MSEQGTTRQADPEPNQESGPEPRLRGVTLAQYAGCEAGLGEGLALEVVLAHEGVDPAVWLDAEAAWGDRLLEDDDPDEKLEEAYGELLAEAQDRYARRIPPIDEGLEAWLDFVRLWAVDPEPAAMLARLGLRGSDLARLHRAWSKKMALDPALAKRAEQILQSEPGELPVPTPMPVAPVPPDPGAGARHPVAGFSASAALDDDDDDDALDDDDDEPDDDDDDALDDDAPPMFVPMPQWLTAEGEVLRMTSSAAARHGPAAMFPPFPEAAQVDAEDAEEDVTLPPVAAQVPPLPFAQAPGAPSPARPMPRAAPPPTATWTRDDDERAERTLVARTEVVQTADLPFVRVEAPALPFAEAAQIDAEEDVTLPPVAAQVPPLPFAQAHGAPFVTQPMAAQTADLPFVRVDTPVLPFVQPRPGSAPIHAASPPEDLGIDSDIESTMPLNLAGIDAARRPALPFVHPAPRRPRKDGSEPPEPSLGTYAALTEPGEATLPPGPSPFARPSPPIEPPPGAPPSGEVPLSLEQYASLCAELAALPWTHEQIFRRYGLITFRQRLRADLQWRERLRLYPAEYREWQALYQRYYAYWSAARGDPPR